MITFDSSVTIICRTKSNPLPYHYTFYKDAVVVQKGNARSFNITQVSYRDQGTYTCAPENIPGRGSSAMLNLTVQGKMQQDLCRRHIFPSYWHKSTVNSARTDHTYEVWCGMVWCCLL